MMSRKVRVLAGVFGGLLCLACTPGTNFFEQGRKAEEKKDWDTAVVDFDKAVQSHPENSQYRLHERYARNQAALFHLEQGKRDLKQNRTEQAIGEFQKAHSIDPSNQAAEQYLARLLALQSAAKEKRTRALQKAILTSEAARTSEVVQLQPLPQAPIARLRISGESQQVFESLGKLANLNVVFTSDFQPRPVSLDLTDVKVGDALRILALQTHTFWRVMTPNTILVVPDNPANRRDYEQNITKAIYLTNPMQPADRTALTTALKQLLGIQRVIDNPLSNSIIIRDTPRRVAEAERLIDDLDRGSAEILIDVDVLEADADRIRDLGLNTTQALSFPSSAGFPAGTLSVLGYTPKAGVTVNGVTGVPLNQLGNSLNTQNFSIALPGAVATALMDDSQTHILDNPEIRVTDGQTAILKIGSSVPIATGSFLPSFGGGITGGTAAGGSQGFGLLASTQFTYKDVGVSMTITPHLMTDGEIELKTKIDISSLAQNFNLGGIEEPSFGQRQIEQDIRLKEGEVSLLGGLIERTNTTETTGLPGLGNIPGLKYLFAQNHREKVNTEVLVMLTPHVIRLPERPVEAASVAPVSAAGTNPPSSPPPAAPPAMLPQEPQ
jgi:general secretion pathway protein D